MLALTTTSLIIGLAVAVALAGFGLMAMNVLAIIRPRKAGEEGPSQPLMGKPQQVSRRGFFRKVMGLGFMGAMTTGLALPSLAMLWPGLAGGFGGLIRLPLTDKEIKAEIKATKLPYYFAPGRVYVVEYNAADDEDGIYTEAGLAAGGLMALYQRCVHLGCRVPFCATSQWFECPCHGSKYNRAGEYRAGPAPRGLDRFPITIDDDGSVTVDTGIIVTGPPRGTDTTGQNPEGVYCVDPSVAADAEHE